MLKNYRTPLLLVLFLLSASTVLAQNKFEGYNLFLDVPETHKTATCALRYVSPQTEITITDLNRATPMKLASCGDASARVEQRGSNAVMRASETNYKWCFTGEDKSYRITFKGDQYAGQITYNWIADAQPTSGTYDIRDFGAVGDGTTDDTIALKSAVAFIASRNGGTLLIPEGDYVVTSPVALVSGIKIQGVSGLQTGAPTNNVVKRSPSRLKLAAKSGALFRIGECVESVVIKDLELYTENNQDTSGIEAVGGFTTSQNFYFERVVFQGFNRGIYAHTILIKGIEWQFDYIKLNHCLFVYNRDTGIYSDVRNADWRIQSSFFYNPPRTPTAKADSMTLIRTAGVLIQDTFGGGSQKAPGGTFLNLLDPTATTIIGSQTEAMTASLILNETNIKYAGDYSYPLNIIGSVFGNPMIFNARRTLVSSGNSYGPKTFQADETLRVYSTGDRFCYDGYTLGCGSTDTKTNFDRATIIFMTGQPGEGMVKGHPTFFGTDVQFGTPVQMSSFLQNVLPTGKANGSLLYCSDCRRAVTPCQAGGTGAPAMVVNNQWSCL